MADPPVISVELDLRANRIVLVARLTPSGTGTVRSDASVTVDVGTGGRLLGVEVGDDYLVLDDTNDPLARSTRVDAIIARDFEDGALHWVSVPRAGPHHEITWPSGNQ